MADDMRSKGANIGTGRRKIAKVTANARVDPGLAEPGEWRNVTSQPPPRPVPLVTVASGDELVQRPNANREVSPVVEDAALQAFFEGTVSGLTATEVEKQFALRRGYLGVALRRRYGNTENLKRVLHASLNEAALVMVEHAMMHVEEMTPAQAMLGANIAVNAGIAVEKSIREAPRTIDFGQLAEIGQGLARLQAFVTGAQAGASAEGDAALDIQPSEDEVVSRY